MVESFISIRKQKQDIKQDIKDIFTRMNQKKLAFSIIWLMEVSKIYLEEQLQIKFYMLKHLILLKIQNMMDIRMELHQCFT